MHHMSLRHRLRLALPADAGSAMFSSSASCHSVQIGPAPKPLESDLISWYRLLARAPRVPTRMATPLIARPHILCAHRRLRQSCEARRRGTAPLRAHTLCVLLLLCSPPRTFHPKYVSAALATILRIIILVQGHRGGGVLGGGGLLLGALGFGLVSRSEEGPRDPQSACLWGSEAQVCRTHSRATRSRSGAHTS